MGIQILFHTSYYVYVWQIFVFKEGSWNYERWDGVTERERERERERENVFSSHIDISKAWTTGCINFSDKNYNTFVWHVLLTSVLAACYYLVFGKCR